MSEIFDKLLIRMIFTLYICASYFVFKYAHVLFYPSHRQQILKNLTPSLNYINTLTFFGRVLGVGIIYSALEFNEYIGMAFSTIHFFIWSTIGISTYLITLFITDWVIFQKQNFIDEVQKKKNSAYGLISFTNAIGVAFILKQLFLVSQYSIIKYAILWLITVIAYGASTRLYKFYSPNSFSKLMIQKNGSLAFGYTGFILCHSLILASSLTESPILITDYLFNVLMRIGIGFILIPVFLFLFRKLFLHNTFDHPVKTKLDDFDHGIYEFLIFIFTGLFISHLLHFVNLNLNFKLVALAILFFAFIYKNLHVFFFPSPRAKFFSLRFKPVNTADLIHIFSRFIGLIIVYSKAYTINSPTEFAIWAAIGFVLYLLSILITENIIFFNFNYHDEIFKNPNYAYIMVNFINAICQGFLISKILESAESSLMNLVVFWLQSLVIYGVSTRLFKYISPLSFNSLMIQKNIGLAIAYSGFLLGNTVIMMSSYTQENYDLTDFLIQVLLKVNLSVLILPLFYYGLTYVFRITIKPDHSNNDNTIHLGQGIYGFSIYLLGAFLTSIIITQIHFGTIYPFF
ncbi:MAG: hypothetical protein VYA54_04785 [Bdellovibrionota bacterium]|nr:hypothetical protein [Bdellovibrionota bacterium]